MSIKDPSFDFYQFFFIVTSYVMKTVILYFIFFSTNIYASQTPHEPTSGNAMSSENNSEKNNYSDPIYMRAMLRCIQQSGTTPSHEAVIEEMNKSCPLEKYLQRKREEPKKDCCYWLKLLCCSCGRHGSFTAPPQPGPSSF